MSKKTLESGFSVLALVCAITLVLLIGVVTWQASKRSYTNNANRGASQQTKATDNKSQQQPDPYANWNAYSSNTGNFTLRYPEQWMISGFQNNTPVGPDYSTGEMNGQETQIRLIRDEDSQNQFGMDIYIGGNSTTSEKFTDGTVTQLNNGLSLWIQKEQDPKVSGRSSICPVIHLVSNEKFSTKLKNGVLLTVTGSFCWSQKSNPNYTYRQQVDSGSFKEARLILESIQSSN